MAGDLLGKLFEVYKLDDKQPPQSSFKVRIEDIDFFSDPHL